MSSSSMRLTLYIAIPIQSAHLLYIEAYLYLKKEKSSAGLLQ